VGFTIGFIAEELGGTVIGNKDHEVCGISPPERIEENSIVFVRNKRAFKQIEADSSVCVIADFAPDVKEGFNFIIIEPGKKDEVFIKLLSLFERNDELYNGIAESAVLSPEASVGSDIYVGNFAEVGKNTTVDDGTRIGSHTVIGSNCSIGKNCVLYPGVTIYPHTAIGDEVIIHSGAVIGSDGFGYVKIDDAYRKIPQIGGVEIGSRVEIGANTTIDRATIGLTSIGENTKIDNLVQIGHNVEIGKNVIICALCGISGSVKIGNNVILAGAVGLKDHIVIEDDVYIGAKAGVMERHVKKGSRLLGAPATNFKSEMEFFALKPKLKGMLHDLKEIKKKLGI